MTGIAWEMWGKTVFERARESGKPIFLFLTSRGSLSGRLLTAALEQDGLARAVAERFTAIRVDADKRPDLRLRYARGEGAGGAILAYDGRLLEYLPFGNAGRFAEALKECIPVVSSKADPIPVAETPVWSGAVSASAQDPELESNWPRTVAAAVMGLAETQVPCPDCMELLLYAACEWGDLSAREVLVSRLKSFASGGLFDRKSGGFSEPDSEPTLGFNARLCRLYWDAGSATGIGDFGDTASAVSKFLIEKFFDDAPGAFRALSGGAGEKIYFTDANAMAALAMIKTAASTGNKSSADAADKALVFLQHLCDPERGMARYWDSGPGPVHGLLQDSSWTLLAFTESFLTTGLKTHREFADGLLKGLLGGLWERERGGFQDRPPDGEFGALRDARIPADFNAVAFEAAWRLHQLKGNEYYRKWVEWGLRRLAADTAPGCAAAPLARVADILTRGRLDLELVGRLTDPKSQALMAALGRHYLPRKIVSFVDPDDQDYIMAHKLQSKQLPRIFGCINLRPKAEAEAPEQVPALLSKLAEA